MSAIRKVITANTWAILCSLNAFYDCQMQRKELESQFMQRHLKPDKVAVAVLGLKMTQRQRPMLALLRLLQFTQSIGFR